MRILVGRIQIEMIEDVVFRLKNWERSQSCFAARNTPVTNLENILLAALAVPPSGGTITRRFAPRKGMSIPKRSFLSVPTSFLKQLSA